MSRKSWCKPKSRSTGRFPQENTENQWNVETVSRSDFFPESSDQFLFISAGNGRKSSGKNPKQFPAGILLPFSLDFQSFPAGTGDFSASSLQYPVTGMIVLGTNDIYCWPSIGIFYIPTGRILKGSSFYY